MRRCAPTPASVPSRTEGRGDSNNGLMLILPRRCNGVPLLDVVAGGCRRTAPLSCKGASSPTDYYYSFLTWALGYTSTRETCQMRIHGVGRPPRASSHCNHAFHSNLTIQFHAELLLVQGTCLSSCCQTSYCPWAPSSSYYRPRCLRIWCRIMLLRASCPS